MLTWLDPLRQLTMTSLMLRLFLAMVLGGAIGMERGLHGRAAGLRTYTLVCVGAASAIILSQYVAWASGTIWTEAMKETGAHVDVSRYGAQIISGIGFLAAGTILITSHREVKGLTTAAGLWASGCLGLALGAGFYECAFIGFGYVYFVNFTMHRISEKLVENSRNMNIYVELSTVPDIRKLLKKCRQQHIAIYDVNLLERNSGNGQNPSAEILMGLPKARTHQSVLAALSDLECVRLIDEI